MQRLIKSKANENIISGRHSGFICCVSFVALRICKEMKSWPAYVPKKPTETIVWLLQNLVSLYWVCKSSEIAAGALWRPSTQQFSLREHLLLLWLNSQRTARLLTFLLTDVHDFDTAGLWVLVAFVNDLARFKCLLMPLA